MRATGQGVRQNKNAGIAFVLPRGPSETDNECRGHTRTTTTKRMRKIRTKRTNAQMNAETCCLFLSHANNNTTHALVRALLGPAWQRARNAPVDSTTRARDAPFSSCFFPCRKCLLRRRPSAHDLCLQKCAQNRPVLQFKWYCFCKGEEGVLRTRKRRG